MLLARVQQGQRVLEGPGLQALSPAVGALFPRGTAHSGAVSLEGRGTSRAGNAWGAERRGQRRTRSSSSCWRRARRGQAHWGELTALYWQSPAVPWPRSPGSGCEGRAQARLSGSGGGGRGAGDTRGGGTGPGGSSARPGAGSACGSCSGSCSGSGVLSARNRAWRFRESAGCLPALLFIPGPGRSSS